MPDPGAGYQDVIDEAGAVISRGYRSCADRWDAVQCAVEGLRRPFTVLDLGASAGYFSVRLTQDFGARCVAVERTDVVDAAEGRVAAVVKANLDATAIHRQGTYDVVLALSFLHHQKNWRDVLSVLLRHTRSALIIETPHRDEKLRQAAARHELGAIEDALLAAGMDRIGSSPGVWDKTLRRGIWLLRRDGIPVTGRVESGSGNNGRLLPRFSTTLADMLGYMPFPGSMNVRTPRAFRLGAYAMEYVDPARGKGGRRGGDYQIWHAQVDGYGGPCHVQRPGVRSHGRDMLEVWAPVRIRDVLGLNDGDAVTVRIGA